MATDQIKKTRRAKRWSLMNYLRVIDQKTDLLIGHLVDINLQGMKLESLKPIPVNQPFKLWVEIVTERVPIEAVSVWSKKDGISNLCMTGFKFINPSEKSTQNINCLIQTLKLYEMTSASAKNSDSPK